MHSYSLKQAFKVDKLCESDHVKFKQVIFKMKTDASFEVNHVFFQFGIPGLGPLEFFKN